MDDLVDEAARVIREWGRGPVVFIGLSMGGMVGQGLAIRHPELVKALVLANTTAQYPEAGRAVMAQRIQKVEASGLDAIADSVIERYFDAPFRASQPEAVQRWRELLLRTDPRGYAACCHAVAGVDWLDRLGEIRCPTLVIAGAQDVGTPVAMAQQIAGRIPGATLEVIDGAAHLSVLEQPAAFEAAVKGLLAKIASA
jgi:3-oxoadipate enol-lactonase